MEMFNEAKKLCLLFLSVVMWASSEAIAADPAVLVYYPTTASAKDRQEALQKAGMTATVYAQFRDFMGAVKSNDPSVVIAPGSFAQMAKEFKPALRFKKDGSAQVKYSMFSMDAKWNPKNLKGAKVGMVEEIDRTMADSWLLDLFQSDFKMVKQVAKPEDIYPLMVFKSADVVVLPMSVYDELKGKYSGKMQTVMTTKDIDNPTVYVKEGRDAAAVIKQIQSMDKGSFSALGFDGADEIGGAK